VHKRVVLAESQIEKRVDRQERGETFGEGRASETARRPVAGIMEKNEGHVLRSGKMLKKKKSRGEGKTNGAKLFRD